MQTLTIQITDDNALKALHALEEKHFIRIVEKKEFASPALPGEAMSLKAFQNWVHASEDSPNITLIQAKAKWANKRKQLQKLTL